MKTTLKFRFSVLILALINPCIAIQSAELAHTIKKHSGKLALIGTGAIVYKNWDAIQKKALNVYTATQNLINIASMNNSQLVNLRHFSNLSDQAKYNLLSVSKLNNAQSALKALNALTLAQIEDFITLAKLPTNEIKALLLNHKNLNDLKINQEKLEQHILTLEKIVLQNDSCAESINEQLAQQNITISNQASQIKTLLTTVQALKLAHKETESLPYYN